MKSVAEALHLDEYQYALPPENIAQRPLPRRSAARLLHLQRASGARRHLHVHNFPQLLNPGDLLVLNAAKVEAARLRGRKASGGRAEALLLGRAAKEGRYFALLKSRGVQRMGAKLEFRGGAAGKIMHAEIAALHSDGRVELAFAEKESPYAIGETPLPPYINRLAPRAEDAQRYQTVYARVPGSVAAPTAGLHFDAELLQRLHKRGVAITKLVLHIGPGTFRPLRASDLQADALHSERFEVPQAAAEAVAAARRRGARVAACGTTAARVLEHTHTKDGRIKAGRGTTNLFLRPGRTFNVVDALLTNFHLPASSLLLLVCAFAGRAPVLAAYREAVARGYRFYSYGDAMWIA